MYGDNIRLARKKKGFKQQEFADRCGLTRESVSRIECGRFKPSLDLLEKMASVLEVTVSDLTVNKAQSEQAATTA